MAGKESGARGRARKALDPKHLLFSVTKLRAISNLGRLFRSCHGFDPPSSMGGGGSRWVGRGGWRVHVGTASHLRTHGMALQVKSSGGLPICMT